MGARPLARLIDNKIKSPLSRKVLFGELQSGGKIDVSIVDDELNFVIGPLLTKEQKKALKRGIPLEEVQSVTENAEKQDN
jgi:ATP-dependent Clp protease ATP-binding subunit ClpA